MIALQKFFDDETKDQEPLTLELVATHQAALCDDVKKLQSLHLDELQLLKIITHNMQELQRR